MLTKLRNMPQVKLAAVTLIGCLILTSCGGGGGEEGGETGQPDPGTGEPTQVTLSLSDSTQDTSQGRAIIVDYEGPAFDEDDLSVSVGDTLVGSVVVNDQIHLILPLTESGQTLLTFDFGSFSSDLSLTIDPAPTIADPPAYISELIGDLVTSLDQLREGDLQEIVDALFEAQAELANLSEDELRALAIFFVQNVDPILQQLDSPTVAQFGAVCGGAINGFIGTLSRRSLATAMVTVGIGGLVGGFALGPPGLILGAIVGVGAAIVTLDKVQDALNDVLDTCLIKTFSEISIVSAGSSSVEVAQDLSPLRFDDGVAARLFVEESHRFAHERRSEVSSATRNLVDTLLIVNETLRQLADWFPNLARRFNLNSFIGKIDRYISEFAAFANPDRVVSADHTNLRLGAISDPNINGVITTATTGSLAIRFAFNNKPSDDCTGFTFDLLNPVDGYNEHDIPAQLCGSSDTEPPIGEPTTPPTTGAICFIAAPPFNELINRYLPCDESGVPEDSSGIQRYYAAGLCATNQYEFTVSEHAPLCPTWTEEDPNMECILSAEDLDNIFHQRAPCPG